jgi:cell division cycle 20-like protein 1 (cofactor of APC complex)
VDAYQQYTLGSLAWNADLLTSGSRDRSIQIRDVREPREAIKKLVSHRQEVCGLKWNPEETHLASGGNDNKLMLWDLRWDEPIRIFNQHNAAIKAITWSPHQVRSIFWSHRGFFLQFV